MSPIQLQNTIRRLIMADTKSAPYSLGDGLKLMFDGGNLFKVWKPVTDQHPNGPTVQELIYVINALKKALEQYDTENQYHVRRGELRDSRTDLGDKPVFRKVKGPHGRTLELPFIGCNISFEMVQEPLFSSQ